MKRKEYFLFIQQTLLLHYAKNRNMVVYKERVKMRSHEINLEAQRTFHTVVEFLTLLSASVEMVAKLGTMSSVVTRLLG